jgi:Tol biopolymer transport system component
MKTTALFAFGIMAALLPVARPQSPSHPQNVPLLFEKKLGEVSGSVKPAYNNRLDSLYVDPTQTHFAIISKENGRESVVVDGQRGAAYDSIVRIDVAYATSYKFFFSPDGKRYAYIGKRDGEFFLIVDGKEITRLDEPIQPYFGPDGRLAYQLIRKEHSKTHEPGFPTPESWLIPYRMVVEGIPSPPKEYADVTEPTFSSDGRHVAYFAREKNSWRAVLDGHEQKKYSDDGFPIVKFSPDGQNYAYFGISRESGKVFLVINGHEHLAERPWYAEGDGNVPRLEIANGGRYAYVTSPVKKQAQYVIVDGHKSPGYNSWMDADVDGREGRGHVEGIEDLTFSPDGHHVAYVGARDNMMRAVIDGVEGPPYYEVGGLSFSTDGKHFAYSANDEQSQFVVLDGKPGKPYASIYGSPTFSPDGRRLCYIAEKAEDARVLVVEGTNPLEFPLPTSRFGCETVFSPDSKHIAWIYPRGKKWVLCIDGHEVGTYDGRPMNAALVFDKSSRLRTIAVRGNEILSVLLTHLTRSSNSVNPLRLWTVDDS